MPDRLDDRREVVVGEDHRGGLLRDLRAGDAHGDADVGALQRRRVVHAVAGHRDDVALALEHVDEAHLVLGRDARDHADAVDLALERLVVAHRRPLGAGDRAAPDPELARDRLGGDGVVAGDHAHLDAGRVRLGDRRLRLRPRRVDDADEREQRSGPRSSGSRSAFGSNVAGSKSLRAVASTRSPCSPSRRFSSR